MKLEIEKLYETIKNNSYSDCERIVIGELFELKINDNEIDIYKYVNQDDISDDLEHDFDDDYLTTIYL